LKVEAECLPCLIERAYREASYLTRNEKLRIQALQAVLETITPKYGPDAYPAWLGTLRDRTLRKFFKGRDPYAKAKIEANIVALKLLPKTEEYVSAAKTTREKFRRACLVAAAANALEFDVKDYGFSYSRFKKSLTGVKFTIDHTREAYKLIKDGGSRILYIADNAGEIVFDSLLAKVLRSIGNTVTLIVKRIPVLNDATLQDVSASQIGKFVDGVETIGDTVGFIWDEAPPRPKELFEKANLIVAKGMGNYEALTELKGKNLNRKILFLLKAKCNPVARSLRVKRESLVALLETI
jgi:hypothetical protein